MKKMKILLLIFLIIILSIFLSSYTEDYFFSSGSIVMQLRSILGFGGIKYDALGIPLVYEPQIKKWVVNPVTVSLCALSNSERLSKIKNQHTFLRLDKTIVDPVYSVTKTEDVSKQTVINCANWLVNNIKEKNNNNLLYYVWEYDIPLPFYNLQPPWISGMAQGLGIQVLTRAYALSGDNIYLKTARQALTPFFVEVQNGGVTDKDSADAWWYEEFAHPKAKESRVLNGMEYALVGIYEYYEFSKDPDAYFIFTKGINALKTDIGRYDTGYWTDYDRLGNISSKKYHRLHIALTKMLFKITGERAFKEYAARWSRYQAKFFLREFLKQKPSRIDIAIFLANVFIVAGILLVTSVFLKTIFFGK